MDTYSGMGHYSICLNYVNDIRVAIYSFFQTIWTCFFVTHYITFEVSSWTCYIKPSETDIEQTEWNWIIKDMFVNLKDFVKYMLRLKLTVIDIEKKHQITFWLVEMSSGILQASFLVFKNQNNRSCILSM